MKKIFTLFATIMMAVCANAGEVELWSGSATVNAWENAPIFLSDTGTELKNAGALPGDFVRFYATAENPNWQIQVVEGHWGPVYAVYAATELTNEDGSPVNNVVVDLNTVGYIEIELTEEILEAAYTQKYWGGVFILNGDGNVEVTKVTLKTALDWNSEPVNIEFNENGFIPASAFEGYNDYAKVQFTYNVAGSLSSYQNWGIGAVQSSDGNTSVVNLPASSLGDITVGCFKKDLQPALDATPDGVLFNVWGFGDGVCVGSRVKVEVFDVVSTGINAVRSEVENENAPIYNLAGQRVDKSYKGVVIQNGKKFIQK